LPWIYVLRCRDGSLYTGATKDLARRVAQHDAGKASKYTRARLPVKLVWMRRVRTWGKALVEEFRLKQLTRAEKLRLLIAEPSARSKSKGKTKPG
jgi:putative endonuclease